MRRIALATVVALMAALALAGSPAAHADPPATPTKWSKVSAGEATTCAIDTDKHLWCWGNNDESEVGDGSNKNRPLPVPTRGADIPEWSSVHVGTQTVCGIHTNGQGYCWGSTVYGQVGDGAGANGDDHVAVTIPSELPGFLRWATIAPGFFDTCGVTLRGGLYCWGSDEFGVLGNGFASHYPSATPVKVGIANGWKSVSVGYYNVCAVKVDGRAFCWGHGADGENGNGKTNDLYVPAQIAGSWKRIEVGGETACGLTTSGVAKCWGSSVAGQTGASYTARYVLRPTALYSQSSDFRSLRTGGNFTCGVTTSREASIRCFGLDDAGEYGDGSPETTNRIEAVPAAGNKTGWAVLSVGGEHACGITTSSNLFCWGYGSSGQLGVGNTKSYDVPLKVGVTPTVPPIDVGQRSAPPPPT